MRHCQPCSAGWVIRACKSPVLSPKWSRSKAFPLLYGSLCMWDRSTACQSSTNQAMAFSWNEMVLFSEILNGTNFPSGKQRHLLSCAACGEDQGTTLQEGPGFVCIFPSWSYEVRPGLSNQETFLLRTHSAEEQSFVSWSPLQIQTGSQGGWEFVHVWWYLGHKPGGRGQHSPSSLGVGAVKCYSSGIIPCGFW